MKSIRRIGAIVFLACFCWGTIVSAQTLDKAMISFTFDDGYRSVFTKALPKLKEQGLVGTANIITDYIGQSWCVTADQAFKLTWNNGWEIGNHTMDHPSLTGLSDEEVKAQIRGARAALERIGVVNVTSLASPYGDYDERVLALMREDGTLYSHRCAWWEDTPFNEAASFDQWHLIVVGMDEASEPMTFDTVKPKIDEAIAGKKWLILMFHDIVDGTPGPYQFNTAELGKIALYVKTNKSLIDCVTVSKGVAKMLKYSSAPLVLRSASTSVEDGAVDKEKKEKKDKEDGAIDDSAPPPHLLIGR
jgi:peptidoglycan/xylan/chitin deacetylase (PgdA/CDA1 family)